MRKQTLVLFGFVFCLGVSLRAGEGTAVTLDQAVDRLIGQENALITRLRDLHPVVEVYIQNLRADRDLGLVPESDEYFLGKSYMDKELKMRSLLGKPEKQSALKRIFHSSMRYLPSGFLDMSYVDATGFNRATYGFEFVRREFLGEVRCLVFDVIPKNKKDPGRFQGRIWVEDEDFNIVRFNGVFGPAVKPGLWYYHFDSWRTQMGPGLWLPAYIYTEETNLKYGFGYNLRFKAQARLWGYNLKPASRESEFSAVRVDAPTPVRDSSPTAPDMGPVEAARLWDRQAEENVLGRLEQAGLLAPEGEVDKVLRTVVNNLEVTNKLDIQPEVRCRVLLTSTLESFSVGHTIILSRGLLDVLPDEASLAAMLAYELGQVLLLHGADTQYAFFDRMLIPDEDVMTKFRFQRSEQEKADAEQKALALLKNSPYKDSLGNAGLFLRLLDARSKELPRLISPHLGNRVLNMRELMGQAPPLEMLRTDQIAALPLGGRIKLDPWSDRIELAKARPVALLSPREKMPFEVTPFWPYLTRQGTANSPVTRTVESKEREAKP